MRTAFIKTLTEIAEVDKNVMLLVGDLGFGVVVDFAERFPKQFLNVGVAEQNMAGVAAGLAMQGKTVFTYSIANFPTLRCLEQIRNDICYHNVNVTVVAVGGGLSYGSLGMSHHATEDIAIMRSLPNMTVVAPGDPLETRLAVSKLGQGIGPAYLRLGRAGEPNVHHDSFDFQIGKAVCVRSGNDATLISTGAMLATATEVADTLSSDGFSVRVLSMHSICPLDHEAIRCAADETGCLITVEEHSLVGGLGSAVAEILCGHSNKNWQLHRIGLPHEFSGIVGDQEYLKQKLGLDNISVLKRVRTLINGESEASGNGQVSSTYTRAS